MHPADVSRDATLNTDKDASELSKKHALSCGRTTRVLKAYSQATRDPGRADLRASTLQRRMASHPRIDDQNPGVELGVYDAG